MFSDTMEKEQYRSVIRFLFLDGKTCEEIKTKLDAVYGNSSPSMTTVKYWFNEFKRGRSSVFEKRQAARHTWLEIVEKVYDMILADRRTKVHEVAEAVGMSYGTAFNILHDNLGMKKLSARLLTVDNKRMLLSISKHGQIALRIATASIMISPDLAPYDFFLFSNLKKWLDGKKFTSNEEIIAETEAYFAEFDKSYFSGG
ncbi:SETMR methyltransferase, partial [Acromyrmex charruanus]